mgnify:FL=1
MSKLKVKLLFIAISLISFMLLYQTQITSAQAEEQQERFLDIDNDGISDCITEDDETCKICLYGVYEEGGCVGSKRKDEDKNGDGKIDYCDKNYKEDKTAGPVFIRGDADGNKNIEITDAIKTLKYLFQNQEGEIPLCQDASDINDDGRLDLSDAIYTLNYLFLGGKLPVVFPNRHFDCKNDDESEKCPSKTFSEQCNDNFECEWSGGICAYNDGGACRLRSEEECTDDCKWINEICIFNDYNNECSLWKGKKTCNNDFKCNWIEIYTETTSEDPLCNCYWSDGISGEKRRLFQKSFEPSCDIYPTTAYDSNNDGDLNDPNDERMFDSLTCKNYPMPSSYITQDNCDFQRKDEDRDGLRNENCPDLVPQPILLAPPLIDIFSPHPLWIKIAEISNERDFAPPVGRGGIKVLLINEENQEINILLFTDGRGNRLFIREPSLDELNLNGITSASLTGLPHVWEEFNRQHGAQFPPDTAHKLKIMLRDASNQEGISAEEIKLRYKIFNPENTPDSPQQMIPRDQIVDGSGSPNAIPDVALTESCSCEDIKIYYAPTQCIKRADPEDIDCTKSRPTFSMPS